MRVVVACLMAACLVAGCAPSRRSAPVAVAIPVAVSAHVAASVQLRVEAWGRLSSATAGTAVESSAAADVPARITQIFDDGLPEGPVDLVFVVDTTGSMADDIDAVKRDMHQLLDHLRRRNPDYRVGVVAYRDVEDDYLTRTFQFLTADDDAIRRAIGLLTVGGGDDWREHVYAGIHTALAGQPWRPEVSQHIILMGDAPPHDDYAGDPRTLEAVTAEARTAPRAVHIHTIGIRCDRTCEDALADEARATARTAAGLR